MKLPSCLMVTIPTCGLLGAQDAHNALHGVISEEHILYKQFAESGVDMFQPDGQWVGVQPAELDDDESCPEPPVVPDNGCEGFSLEEMLDCDGAAMDELVPAAQPEVPRVVPVLPQVPQLPIIVPVLPLRRAVVRALTDFPGYASISPDHATKLYFEPEGSKSSERMNRVMEHLKAGTRAVIIDNGDGNDIGAERAAGVHAETDPILVLVGTDAGVSIVLAVAISFNSPDGSRALAAISTSELQDPRTSIHCRALPATQAAPGVLTFETSLGEEFRTTGDAVSTFNPGIRDNGAGRAEWFVEVDLLQLAMEALWSGCTRSIQKLPVLSGSSSGYHSLGLENSTMLIVSGTKNAEPAGLRPKVTVQEKVQCEICKQMWTTKMLRHHIGAHLLLPDSWGTTTRHRYPCGLCGVRPAAQFSHMCSSAAECQVSVPSATRALHKCKHYTVPPYTLGPAGNSTVGAPCSNIPLKCRKCPQKPMPVVVYKYSMQQHWNDCHATTEMDDLTKGDIQMGDNEIAWVRQLLTRKTVKANNK
jgi:hypothetical protein